MSDGVVASGRTLDEAIDRALEMLGASDDEVEIQVLSEGGGVLERGEAKVRVRLRDERTPEEIALARAAERAEEPLPASADLQAEAAAGEEFLRGLLETMRLEGDVASSVIGGAAQVELSGPNLALLIGRRGATLEALQEVTRAAVQRHTDGPSHLTLDIEGYRARRKALLERRARSAAARVRRSGKPVALEPMSAYERKIIHDALADFRGVRTSSEGEGPDRHVVVVRA